MGKVDWDLRRFHGHELSTHRGSTYNSYLVRDEKNVLIDTAWTPYAHEYVEKLAREIDLQDIDFIVANHSEADLFNVCDINIHPLLVYVKFKLDMQSFFEYIISKKQRIINQGA